VLKTPSTLWRKKLEKDNEKKEELMLLPFAKDLVVK